MTGQPPQEATSDDLLTLQHLVNAYDEGVEVSFKPAECYAALVRLNALASQRDEALRDLDDVHTALAERNVPRSDGIDEPLWSEGRRVRWLGARAERAEAVLTKTRAYIAKLQDGDPHLLEDGEPYHDATIECDTCLETRLLRTIDAALASPGSETPKCPTCGGSGYVDENGSPHAPGRIDSYECATCSSPGSETGEGQPLTAATDALAEDLADLLSNARPGSSTHRAAQIAAEFAQRADDERTAHEATAERLAAALADSDAAADQRNSE